MKPLDRYLYNGRAVIIITVLSDSVVFKYVTNHPEDNSLYEITKEINNFVPDTEYHLKQLLDIL